MTHLRAIERKRGGATMAENQFPFSVPAIRTLGTLDLSASVTFFVGENGSGKSTLLEGIAAAAHLPTVGSAEIGEDATLGLQRRLASAFRLTWETRTHRGFFLRAEDFFGFARRIAQLRAELKQRVADVDTEFRAASDYVKGLAAGPAAGSLAELTRRYGSDLDARSHGESFLKLFEARMVPGGLYLLDEPEAALSPQNQLLLLALLLQMVQQDSQFIIATHSPMLLAFPEARIYDFDREPIAEVKWEELEHVTLTRAFLENPERFLRRL
ncbi:MAG: AAA family ATPase [Longimicrobiales bacterium]